MKNKYKIVESRIFRRDLKIAKKRGYDLAKIIEVVNILAAGEALPARYKDHPLFGDYHNCRECHIYPDWLLIYEIDDNRLFLYLVRNGSHSDLF